MPLARVELCYTGVETWPAISGDMIRLERKGVRMTRWICGITPEDKIFTVKLRNLLKLNTMRECLQNRRLISEENMRFEVD